MPRRATSGAPGAGVPGGPPPSQGPTWRGMYDPKLKPRRRLGPRGRRGAAACLVASCLCCSWGARRLSRVLVLTRGPQDTSVRPWGASSYAFRHVCVAMNAHDQDQGPDNSQRTVVWFNRSDDYEKRCVSCNNPVMTYDWNGIPDYVADLDPRWREEGGLLKDSGRPCGMMWDNVLVASSVDDARACRARHAQEVADRGQEVGMSRVVQRPQAAVVLQWYHGNPGHQLLDCLLSQIDLFRHHPGPFESHQACDATEWYCAVLRMLGVTVVQVPPDALACYDEAVVPRLGLYGRGAAQLPADAWRWLRARVGTSTAPAAGTRVLLYAHNSTGRRVWLDMGAHAAMLRRAGAAVESVADFAAHSVAEQARMFRRATHVIMPHGGQWANILFAAPGAHLWELSCPGYSHVATGLPMETWDHHAVRLVDHGGCTDDGLDSNFTVPLATTAKWLGVALPSPPEVPTPPEVPKARTSRWLSPKFRSSTTPNPKSECWRMDEVVPDFEALTIQPSFLQHLQELSPIPHIAHVIWTEGNLWDYAHVPMIKYGVGAFKPLNPEWDLRIYTAREVDDFLQQHLEEEDWFLLEHAHIVTKSDIFRLLLMYHVGGFYQDVDRLYNIPMSKIDPAKLWLPFVYDMTFTTDMLCSAPHNDLFQLAIHMYLCRLREQCRGEACNWETMDADKRHIVTTEAMGTFWAAATQMLFGRPVFGPREHERQGDEGAAFAQHLRHLLAQAPDINTYRETWCHLMVSEHPKCEWITKEELWNKVQLRQWDQEEEASDSKTSLTVENRGKTALTVQEE